MTRIRWRRGSAADWTAADPILLSGEVGYETDTNSFKVGDGSTPWSGLAYFDTGGGAGSAWSVLTNGDPVTPELIFDGNGDVIMVETLR